MQSDELHNTRRYLCSNCKETWDMAETPVACPHCGNEVVAGYREIREVAVRPDDVSGDDLPEFNEVEG